MVLILAFSYIVILNKRFYSNQTLKLDIHAYEYTCLYKWGATRTCCIAMMCNINNLSTIRIKDSLISENNAMKVLECKLFLFPGKKTFSKQTTKHTMIKTHTCRSS